MEDVSRFDAEHNSDHSDMNMTDLRFFSVHQGFADNGRQKQLNEHGHWGLWTRVKTDDLFML